MPLFERFQEVLAGLPVGDRVDVVDVAQRLANIADGPASMREYTILTDDHSGHGLPAGARVQYLHTDEDGTRWFTQGGDGDERAIDPRDFDFSGRSEVFHG